MRQLEELKRKLSPQPEGKILVGLSGGADSVALIYLLLFLREEGTAYPEAVHVNHGLRGNESEADEAFVRELCRKNEIPLHVERIDLGGRRIRWLRLERMIKSDDPSAFPALTQWEVFGRDI